MDGNKCPVCLKSFDSRQAVRAHMKSKGHTIDGHKALSSQSDEARMAAYHRERAKDSHAIQHRYGK